MYHTVPDFSLAAMNSENKSNCICEEDGINAARGKNTTCNPSPGSELEKKFKVEVKKRVQKQVRSSKRSSLKNKFKKV